MEDLSFAEKTKRIEATAKEALKGLEDLRLMMAKETVMPSTAGALPPAEVPQSSMSPIKASEELASNLIDTEGEKSSKIETDTQSRRSKIKLWTKRALKNVGTKEIHIPSQTPTSKGANSTLKKTGWKLRSPLTRRGASKESAKQTAEIEKLKQTLKDQGTATDGNLELEKIESMRAEIRKLEEYKSAAARLAQEKLESQPKVVALREENKLLKEEKQRLEPLVQVGKAVRLRVYETYDNETNLESEQNMAVIRNGNKAAHHGNVAADAALFFLKLIDSTRHMQAFETIYQIGRPENYHGCYLSERATQLLNYRGTVELSVHYPDKSVYDTFIALERKWRAFITTGGMSLSTISPNLEMTNAYLRLEELTNSICSKARAGKICGAIPRSAKHLQLRSQKGVQKISTPDLKEAAGEVKMALAETSPIDESKNVKKKKKKKKKNAGMFAQAKIAALEMKIADAKAVVTEKEEALQKPSPTEAVSAARASSPSRIDIAQLGRVEVEVPGFFGIISSIFGYGG